MSVYPCIAEVTWVSRNREKKASHHRTVQFYRYESMYAFTCSHHLAFMVKLCCNILVHCTLIRKYDLCRFHFAHELSGVCVMIHPRTPCKCSFFRLPHFLLLTSFPRCIISALELDSILLPDLFSVPVENPGHGTDQERNECK